MDQNTTANIVSNRAIVRVTEDSSRVWPAVRIESDRIAETKRSNLSPGCIAWYACVCSNPGATTRARTPAAGATPRAAMGGRTRSGAKAFRSGQPDFPQSASHSGEWQLGCFLGGGAGVGAQ